MTVGSSVVGRADRQKVGALALHSWTMPLMTTRKHPLGTALMVALAVAGLVPLVLLALLVLASLVGRWEFRGRQAFWDETLAELPAGVSRDRVERAFLAHGIRLGCAGERDGIIECVGRDTRSYGVLPEWHIRFTVRFERDALQSVEQTALGVGL